MLLLSKKQFFHSFHGCPDYYVGAFFDLPGKGQVRAYDLLNRESCY